MPKTESGRILPDGYKAPTTELQSFSEEGLDFKYKLNNAGQVDYRVYDSWEKKVDNNICTVHQFEMGMAALVDDEQLVGSEYEDAELSQGSIVRWIP